MTLIDPATGAGPLVQQRSAWPLLVLLALCTGLPQAASAAGENGPAWPRSGEQASPWGYAAPEVPSCSGGQARAGGEPAAPIPVSRPNLEVGAPPRSERLPAPLLPRSRQAD